MPANDPTYQTKYYKVWYEENKESHKSAVQERKKMVIRENRYNILEYLKVHHCVDCGESDPVVLQFDHVRGEKAREVSTMVSTAFSWERISQEIEKCDVRCANCHIRKTAKDFNHYKTRIQFNVIKH